MKRARPPLLACSSSSFGLGILRLRSGLISSATIATNHYAATNGYLEQRRSFYHWKIRKDKKKRLRAIIKRNQARAQRKEAAEAGEEEEAQEEAPEEEAAAEEAAEGEGVAAEGKETEGGPTDGRPSTADWEGHPYDYPWTEEERAEAWFSEEELPRHLFDLLNFPDDALGGAAISELYDDDTGRVTPPPPQLTRQRDRDAWKRSIDSLLVEEYDDWLDEWVEEYREGHGPRPCLSQRTKDQINELHKLDPENWNLTTLSLKYGLSKARVKALLMFGKMEEVAAAHGELLPDLSADMEDLFGVEDRFDDKIRLVMHDQKGFGATMPEEGLDRGKLQERLRRLLPKRPPNDEVPLEPPEELVELRESKILFEPPPNMANRARGMLVIDMDDDRPVLGPRRQKKDDKTRLIWVHEPSGVIRTANWMERYWLHRHKNPKHVQDYIRPTSQTPAEPKESYTRNFGPRVN